MPVFNLLQNTLYELTIYQQYPDGQTVENIFVYRTPQSAPVQPQTSLTLMTAAALKWAEVVNTCQANGFFTQRYRLVEIVIANASRQRFDDLVAQLEGGIAQEALPPSVALVVRRHTNIVGRRNRGRWFLCGLPKTYSVAGQLNVNPFVAAGGDAAVGDMTIGQLQAPGGIPIADPVLPRPNRELQEPFSIVSYDPRTITGSLVDVVLRSQRRRENGVGI